MSVIVIWLIACLIFFYKKKNKTYLILVSLFIISFFSQFFVGRKYMPNDFISLFNLIFICSNIFLIIIPWNYGNFKNISVINFTFFKFFTNILFKVLFINLILNFFILLIVLIYIPNITSFKAEQAFLLLYDQIPYFATIFRYAYVSQNLGYFAIPIFFYYISRFDNKKAFLSLIFSCSSLVSGFAFYSRAQIFTFVLTFICFFYLIKNTLPLTIGIKINNLLKKTSFVIFILFIIITVLRFSAMDYYGDRIPSSSLIKDPILFSFVDYASQGFSNGFNQLEVYNQKKYLGGEQMFRDVYQILNYFGIIAWDVKESQEKIDFSYGYDGGAFNGYTAPLVFNFGYLITIIISLIYFLYVRFQLKIKSNLILESNLMLVFLLFIPIVSIFYVGYHMLYFPLFFIIISKFIYKIKYLVSYFII